MTRIALLILIASSAALQAVPFLTSNVYQNPDLNNWPVNVRVYVHDLPPGATYGETYVDGHLRETLNQSNLLKPVNLVFSANDWVRDFPWVRVGTHTVLSYISYPSGEFFELETEYTIVQPGNRPAKPFPDQSSTLPLLAFAFTVLAGIAYRRPPCEKLTSATTEL